MFHPYFVPQVADRDYRNNQETITEYYPEEELYEEEFEEGLRTGEIWEEEIISYEEILDFFFEIHVIYQFHFYTFLTMKKVFS